MTGQSPKFRWIRVCATILLAALLLFALAPFSRAGARLREDRGKPGVSRPGAIATPFLGETLVLAASSSGAGQEDAERQRQRRLLAGLIALLVGVAVVYGATRKSRKPAAESH